MAIAFFATRKIQKTYFSKLATLIPGSKVIYYKDCLIPGFTRIPYKDINNIVKLLIAEKQNHPRYRNKTAGYWFLFKCLKLVEACWLYLVYYRELSRGQYSCIVIWNGLKYRQCIIDRAAISLNFQRLFMENGLLPGFTTLDPKGINYINSVPRDPKLFLQLHNQDFQVDCLNKKGLEKPRSEALPENYIFIPFQVNTDSQVIRFSPWIKEMFSLVEEIACITETMSENSPVFVLKPHPACPQDYSSLFSKYADHPNIRFITSDESSTEELIRHSNAVITINSTVGIEALIMEKPVIVLGQAFYSMEGLTLSASDSEQLRKAISAVTNWKPNRRLLNNFFSYLAREYQLPGRWQDATDEHLQHAAERIITLASDHD